MSNAARAGQDQKLVAEAKSYVIEEFGVRNFREVAHRVAYPNAMVTGQGAGDRD